MLMFNARRSVDVTRSKNDQANENFKLTGVIINDMKFYSAKRSGSRLYKINPSVVKLKVALHFQLG